MTNFRNVYKSDHLGVIDLEEMIESNTSLIVTIKEVKQERGAKVAGKAIDANIAYFDNIKPLVLNSTNANVIRRITGSSHIENWSGTTIELYIDYSVKMKGEVTGGVRIKAIEKPKEKEKLSDDRFAKALQAIADGKITRDSLIDGYALTDEQLLKL